MSDHDDQLSPDMAVFQEPPFDPEDTSPSGVFRPDRKFPTTAHKTDRIQRRKAGLPVINWLLSGAAALITLAAALIYLQQSNPAPQPTVQSPTNTVVVIQPTALPTLPPPTLNPTTVPVSSSVDAAVPADVVAELLMQPGDTVPAPDQIYRRQTAYTIAPARTRAGVEEYTIKSGDTLAKIAERFGLSEDTLVWNNDDIFVNRLQPGDKLTILPENGILYKTASEETIQAIADKYKVSPYAIIDSEYNRLQNASPATLLPANQSMIVPGGTSTQKARYWNPGVIKRAAPAVSGGSGASSNAAGEISFGGGPGSCGYQPNAGGGGGLRIPLPGGYTVIRGFYPGHTGIDLASPIGTTVFAADGGTVIFAGWSNWGYGNSIVLAHGSLLTLYGHLSRINVSCGQRVGSGQPIGAVGSTGNSSGPHLHFEIRPGGGEPVNPVGVMGF